MGSGSRGAIWLAGLVGVAGCGQPPTAAADGGGVAGDSGATRDAGGTEAGDAWTQCVAPSGASVCGGPAQCPVGTSTCETCFAPMQGVLEPCVTAGSGDSCVAPPDGEICYSLYDPPPDSNPLWMSTSYDVGVLFDKGGASSRLRYADFGLWTGDSLPTPSTCPTVTGFQLCGPACPACGDGGVCTGRSPLHPWGICGQVYRCGTGYSGCPAGQQCLVYTVQPAAQALADAYGMCLPSSECQAASAQYPGGATCQ
jgi:hypothetical protein